MLAAVSTPGAIALTCAIGYVVGSVPVAAIVARRHGVDDLGRVGDRNPGFWNAREQIGWVAALPVFVGDIAKGAVSAAVGGLIAADGHWWMPYVGGAAAMVGHAWPLFARFAGGRSVLTFVGAAMVVAPLPAVVSWSVLAVVWVVTGAFDRAARVAVFSFPICQLVLDGATRTAATGALMTLVGLRFAQALLRSRTSDPATPADA